MGKPLRIVVALSHDDEPYVKIQDKLTASDVPESEYALVRSEGPRHLEALMPETDVLIAWGLAPELLPKAKRLKWLHLGLVGVGELMYPELLESDIRMTNSMGFHHVPVAEHVFALILTYTRALHISIRNQLERRWNRRPAAYAVYELSGKTLGIVGLGKIGRSVAKLGHTFGMRVIGYDIREVEDENVDRVYAENQLPKLLEQSDFVVLCVPYTSRTERIISIDEIRAMKQTAFLVNVGRGRLIDEPILIEALSKGWIAGAGLDVFETEPLPPDSPFYNLGNVIMTPHIAGATPDYWDHVGKIFTDNLKSFLACEKMATELDKTVYK
jgi:phosphoglycerate dehydrogenase-like enzyme